MGLEKADLLCIVMRRAIAVKFGLGCQQSCVNQGMKLVVCSAALERANDNQNDNHNQQKPGHFAKQPQLLFRQWTLAQSHFLRFGY